MNRAHISYVEFYITNVCDFNCEGCNRLNNYHFTGHQLWKDYAEVYEQWAEKLDIGRITILGGEPTLNPSLPEWITNIRRLWPRAEMMLLTNGTNFHRVKNLYELIKNNNVLFSVQLHNMDRYDDIIDSVRKLLVNPVFSRDTPAVRNHHKITWKESYNQVKDPSWPDVDFDTFHTLPENIQQECINIHKIDPETFMVNAARLLVTDDNNVRVSIDYAESFWLPPIWRDNNTFHVYNSDPVVAHEVCPSKNCTHLIRGKMYKCHNVALLPEFSQQFYVDISKEDQTLLDSYQPLTADKSVAEMQQFIDRLTGYIDQCKLCPSEHKRTRIKSSNVKPKVLKRF